MKPYPVQLAISGPTAMWTRPDTGSSVFGFGRQTSGLCVFKPGLLAQVFLQDLDFLLEIFDCILLWRLIQPARHIIKN